MKQNTPRSSPRKPAPKTASGIFSWLTPKRKRAFLVIFMLSFVVSLVMELYVFGFPDGFFGHWFSAMLVLFFLISGTVLGIIPLVNYVANRWLRF
ncbi:DUF2798 domain-containing protein [Adhaeribacter terreus]|uniref:DUF2798 domain-containing protein n=1 Tax=Adhaeribacter terreus TaxID=529703 RepID=A0ABW0E404_9BACT